MYCDVKLILSFLQELLDKGLSPQSLKVYVAAVSACHSEVEGKQVGSLLLISRFMRGARRLRPRVAKMFPKWDLVTVLGGLSVAPFEPLESVDLKYLSLKTALLLALASGKRVGDLIALSVHQSCMVFSDDNRKVTLRPNPAYQPKSIGAGFRSSVIHLEAFRPPPSSEAEERQLLTLCPIRTLRSYVERTRGLRTSNQLLVCHGDRSRGKPLSKNRLSHWIVDAIALAYAAMGVTPPEGIKAHSTRGVAASWALLRGVSVEDMCAAASWSSHHTFVRYYCLDMTGVSFAHTVLSASREQTL